MVVTPERQLWPSAAIAVPVGHQVVRNAVQPRRKWNAAIYIAVNMVHRPLENTGCEVLCIVQVACPVVYVVEDPIHVALIEPTERLTVAL